MERNTGKIEKAGDCNDCNCNCSDQKTILVKCQRQQQVRFLSSTSRRLHLAHYRNSPSSIREPWTTLFYLANYLFMQQQPHKTLYENYYFFSKIGRNVHYVFPIKLLFSIFRLKSIKFSWMTSNLVKVPLLGLSASYNFTLLPQTLR